MATPTVVTDAQIFELLKYLVNLVPALYVDEAGCPRMKKDDEYVYVGVTNDADKKKPMILYGAPQITSDYVVLNPFVEGMSKSKTNEWFFTILVVGSTNYIRWIQKTLLNAALEARSKKKADKLDLELAGIVSAYVEDVDETTSKEFDQLTSKMLDYFNIYYLSRKREARISCGLIGDDNFRMAHKKVRAKTWKVLTNMIKKIFDTEDFSEYTVVSKVQGCPELDATLRILLKVYTMLNRYMKYLADEIADDINITQFDLDYLSTAIDQLDLMRAKAKYLVPTAAPIASSLANAVGAPTQANPINNVQPTIGVPGAQLSSLAAAIGVPGGNMNSGVFVQPQANYSVGFGASTNTFGIPGTVQPQGGSIFDNVGVPGTQNSVFSVPGF